MRMRKATYYLCAPLCAALLLCAACSRRPEGVLSDEKTASLLCDLHIADAYGTLQGTAPDGRMAADETERKVLRQSVLAAHGVTEAQLDTTLGWYGHNLDKYEEMYELVLEDIAAKKTMLAGRAGKAGGAGLWPYGARQRIAGSFGADATLVPFEVAGGTVPKGGKLAWEAKTINMRAPLEMFMAAQYTDGSINYVQRTLTGAGRQRLTLQTDSSRRVESVWGYLRLRQPQPLILDSVSLTAERFDKTQYYEYRATKAWPPRDER